jgi:NAD(P)-dependent dehydrogenase (short-subunit alcohol dehydrogenase family)
MNVLITGVSTGIGATTAELLLRSGHDVYGTVRKLGDADQLALHPAFSALVMDVTNRPSIVKAMATIKASGKPLHAVINNAGIAVPGPLETIAEEDYRKQFDVNVFGNLAVSQEALPLLHAAREAGETNVKIINVSSVSGYVTAPFTSLYSASKFAVEALTDGLRRELSPFGIDVLSVAPGPVKTPIWRKANTQTKAFEGTRYAGTLDKLGAYTEATEAGAIDPELVAGIIHDMLKSERPRPDRLVTKKNWIIRLLMLAPKRWQDKMFLKNMEANKRD